MTRLLIIAFCLFSFSVHAETENNLDLQKAVSKIFPGEVIYQLAEGKLGEEGNHYIAALAASHYNDMRLLLLLRQHPKKFKIVAHSQLETAVGRSAFAVKISKRSVFMSVYSSGGCCSYSDTTYQFKKHGNKFMLVGVEGIYRAIEQNLPTDSDTKLLRNYHLKSSANFLINKVVHSRKSWHSAYHQDEYDDKPVGKVKYAELALNIENPIFIEIQDFSLDAYSEFKLSTKSLCGSLGGNMKFAPYSSCKVK